MADIIRLDPREKRIEELTTKIRTLEELYNTSIMDHERLMRDLHASQLRVIELTNALNVVAEVFDSIRPQVSPVSQPQKGEGDLGSEVGETV